MRTAKEILKDFKSDYVWKFWDEAIEFLLDWQSEHEDLGIVDCDLVDELVKHEAEQGYQRVAHFIAQIIDNLACSYYKIDGYGNLAIIEVGDIECWLGDIANSEEIGGEQ